MNTLQDIDALLVSTPTNIRYLTGFTGASPEEREAYALLTHDTTFLFTHALYIEQAQQLPKTCASSETSLTVVEISRDTPLSQRILEIATQVGIKKLGFENTNIRVSEYESLIKSLTGIALVSSPDRIEKLRTIKRNDEIVSIKKAAALTDLCFNALQKLLKPGACEQDLAWFIESFFKTHGAALAFPPIVAFGPNSSMPHYDNSSNATLATQDIVLLDFAARVNGYCADMTRTVFVGTPKSEWRNAYNCLLGAQQKALDYLQTNSRASGADVDKLVRMILETSGFPVYPHSLGHGLGLDIHEAPRLSIKTEDELQPNMVITIEPGIYVPGKYGIRIEDLVLLNERGIEILSTSPKTLTIL